jgi:hypothetical protein
MCPVFWHLKQIIVLHGDAFFEGKMGDSTEVSASDDFSIFSFTKQSYQRLVYQNLFQINESIE